MVRSRQEKFDPARADFEAALKENPDDGDLHNNLGVLEYMEGHLKAARKHFRKALRLLPDNTNAVLNLCDIEVAEGKFAAAVALCEAHLEKNNDLAVRRRLLDLLSHDCRHTLDKASQVAEILLVKDGENHEARRELGRLIQARQALVCENS